MVHNSRPRVADKKWGSFHCKKFKSGGKCDLCKHMVEKDLIHSLHFGISSKIHGNLSHDQFSNQRWRTHKSTCNLKNSNSTGLSKHFKEGCPNDTGKEKETLDVTLIDYLDTSRTRLIKANHEPGPKCRCSECDHLKSIEDSLIIKLGTFYEHGLNSRNEIKARSRDS